MQQFHLLTPFCFVDLGLRLPFLMCKKKSAECVHQAVLNISLNSGYFSRALRNLPRFLLRFVGDSHNDNTF